MPTKDFLTLALSSLALGVALYGVWERRRDTRRQLQVRLSELIDEVNSLGLEQDKFEADGELGPGLGASYNARRELLTRDATTLIGLSSRRAQPSRTASTASWHTR